MDKAVICSAVVDNAFLTQFYESYSQVEEQFQQAMDHSLDPGRPEMPYELAAEFDLPPGAAALDVGCGEGGAAIELAKRFGLTVHGVDPVPWHIEVARQQLGDCLWHVYRMIGKLSGRIYVLSAPAAGPAAASLRARPR